jgi:predicted transcriptional regulator
MAKKIISLEISDELKEKLRREAFEENKSVSALIRDILIDYIANKETKDE